jgi:hypothetical protein
MGWFIALMYLVVIPVTIGEMADPARRSGSAEKDVSLYDANPARVGTGFTTLCSSAKTRPARNTEYHHGRPHGPDLTSLGALAERSGQDHHETIDWKHNR